MDGSIDQLLGDLALLVRVVDAGGFTAAARVTGTPQPTISRRLALLEEQLGLQLLQRSTRSVTMTEAGRRVYDHAVLMIASGEAAAAAAATMKTEAAGLVRITAPVILGRAFVAPVISALVAQHPKLLVDVEWTTRRVDLLHDGVDVAVGIGRPSASELILVRLGHAKKGIYAPPGWTGPEPKHPSALDGMTIVGIGRSTDAPPVILERAGERATIHPAWRMAANDGDLVLETAHRCGLPAVVPDFIVPEGWRPLMPDWGAYEEVNAVTTAGRLLLPKIRLLLDALKAQVQVRGVVRSSVT